VDGLTGDAAVRIEDLAFAYRAGRPVLSIARLDVRRGERLFVYGPSGSGKTTLLGLLAGVLHADRGVVDVLGQDMARMSGPRRDAFRAEHVGYIFQLFNLIPYLSVTENITLPCRISAARRARLRGRSPESEAARLMEHLGLASLAEQSVTDLSVGQQQRVAAARALIGAPALVIADEPTSALDTNRREAFLQLLFESCDEAGSTLIFVSHDRTLMPLFSRDVSLPHINAVPVEAA
jgi:putative ABC transport system ATP-binding protein